MTVINALQLDDAYPHSYEIELLHELPNSPSTALYYLPPNRSNGGPILRVTNADGRKLLVIVAGRADDIALSTWPNSDQFVVLPVAWVFDTRSPDKSYELSGFEGHSLHYVFPVPEHKAIILGHCCGLYCYGIEGLMWKQDDLFCCDDPALGLSGATLLVTAHKHGEDPGNEPVLKRLDLFTGKRLDIA